jgi:hypothetical protein
VNVTAWRRAAHGSPGEIEAACATERAKLEKQLAPAGE